MNGVAVLAVDPSLTNTAVVVGDGLWCEIKTFGSANLGKSVRERVTRYERLADDILFWATSKSGRILAVFIEAYSYGSNDANAKFSAEFGGILRQRLLKQSNSIFEVAPTTLKKFVTGTGKGKKVGVISHLSKDYGVTFQSDDEFDAYGLYRLGLVAEGICEPANQAQREAADTVLGIKTTKKGKRNGK